MSKQDQDDEGFLTRWSRRKREIAASETAPPAPPAVLPAEAASPAPEPEPEMIEPPSLDLVDKDFDVAHWLKQNVPESWKLAALRRAWESDPAIRDFENPARDYALDWNTPGGAPGYGPLTESDDVEAMVRGIFGDKEPETEVAEAAEQAGDSMSHELSSKDESGDNDGAARDKTALDAQPAHLRLSEGGPDAPKSTEIAPPSSSRVYAAVQNNPEPGPAPVRNRKRGGGAIPI